MMGTTGGTWERLLVWKLSGGRYDDHQGVELSDLGALVHLRTALIEVAKAVWKRRHAKARIPDHVEDDVDLRVRSFEQGCVESTVWLRVPPAVDRVGQGLMPFADASPRDAFFAGFHEAAWEIQTFLRTGEASEVFSDESIQAINRFAQRAASDTVASIRALKEPVPPPVLTRLPEASTPPDPPQEDHVVVTDSTTAVVVREPARGPWFNTPAPRPYPPYEGSVDAPDASEPEETDVEGIPEAARGATVNPSVPVPPPSPSVPPAAPPPTTPLPPEVEVEPAAAITPEVRQRLSAQAAEVQRKTEARQERRTIEGEILMVSLLGSGEAVLVMVDTAGEKHEVQIRFSDEDKKKMTSALDNHEKVRIRARGIAHLTARDRIHRFDAQKIGIVQAADPDGPSEQLFQRLALEDPARLIAFVASPDLSPGLLTYAAEIAGEHLPSESVVPLLTQLLAHPSAVVREGAICGLRFHKLDKNQLELLQHLAANDPNPGIRLVASGALRRD